MNELIKIKTTMSSREIAELTGKRHDNILRDCDKLNETYLKMSLPKSEERDYTDNRGKVYREFLLTKMQTFDLMTGYNTELRIKVNRRWEELEKKNQLAVPSTYGEALLEAGRLAIENDKLANAIEAQKPAVDFYKSVTDSKNAIPMSQVAKVLDMGIGRNKLFEKLRNLGILMHDNEPYQSYIDRGYFRVVEQKFVTSMGETRINIKTLVYQKGLDYIRKSISM